MKKFKVGNDFSYFLVDVFHLVTKYPKTLFKNRCSITYVYVFKKNECDRDITINSRVA